MVTDPVDITNRMLDVPFGQPIADADVEALLTVPPFNRLDPKKFPATLPLAGILANDAAVHCQSGDIIMRFGEYGNSAFFVAAVRLELGQLPASLLGRNKTQKKRGSFRPSPSRGRTTASRKS